jgi:hypothetical protein
MNSYALIRRQADATAIVAKVQASTQGQAARRLYRANRIDPSKAAELGFTVEFQKPAQQVSQHG